jgi:RNAse (barnase) inhibitor barstar
VNRSLPITHRWIEGLEVITLMALLKREHPTGAYLVGAEMTSEVVKQTVEQMGFNFLYLDGRRISTVQDFFAEASRAFRFPKYHGENWTNWDALADFLKDLENIPAAVGDVIMFDEFQRFAQNDPANFFIAFRHLESVAQVTNSGYPMYVLLRATAASTTDKVLPHLPLVS